MYGYDPEKQSEIEELKAMWREICDLRTRATNMYTIAVSNQCQADEVMLFLAGHAWNEIKVREQEFRRRMAETQIDKRLIGCHV